MFQLWSEVETLSAIIDKRNKSAVGYAGSEEERISARQRWFASSQIMNEAERFIKALWEYSRTHTEQRVAAERARQEGITLRRARKNQNDGGRSQ
jgi:hypothetical protein